MSKNDGKGFGKFLAGIGIGAGLGLLFAPKSGEETRKLLKKKIDELVDEVKKMDVNEVKDEFLTKVDEIKKGLDELDKETVLKAAKKKGNELKDKANELVELAKEKGTPVLEGIADDLKEKTISVAQGVIDKLEEK